MMPFRDDTAILQRAPAGRMSFNYVIGSRAKLPAICLIDALREWQG